MKKRPWFNFYTKGVPKDIDPDIYASLNELFDENCQKYSDLEAFVHMGTSVTYKSVNTLADRFAAYLVNELNLEKGDRIAFQMPNLLQYPVCVIGALRAGLVIVNTNPLYSPREMDYQFRDAGIKAIVILNMFASKLEKILPDLPELKHVIITQVGDLLGGVKGSIVNLVVKHIKKMVPKYHISNAIPLRKILNSNNSTYTRGDITASDTAFIQYTGGTTGTIKGAVLSHRNLLANVVQHKAWLKETLVYGEEVVITALPLYHIFAMTVNFITFFAVGSKNILITNPKDMKDFMKNLRKYPFSLFTGVNTLFNGLMNHPEFNRIDFSKLKLSIAGGMAVMKTVADRWKEKTGVLLMEGYGLTETSPVVCIHPFDGQERTGTIGIPLPGTDVIICDEAGKELPPETDGELCIKGPQVMSGYWQNEKETKESFVNGYFRTGDIARMTEDGFFSIIDRKKEMINVSGFNVYPREVEDVIAHHPKVLEVGVKGEPDERSGEVTKAFIVKKDPSLTEEEIRAYCKSEMTSYKVPRIVVFRDELPKSNVGKILRKDLK